MKLYATLRPFSKTDTDFIKGVSILLIALHNYYRWVNPITGENEFWFSSEYLANSITALRLNPLEIFNVFFNFLGYYGVQGFIIISAYGLTLSYRNKRPGYGSFILGRFNKLYPSFVFAAVLYIFVLISSYGKVVDAATLKELGLQLTLLGNFIPGKAMTICGPWWFYSFIFQFYLIFPLLMLVVDKWGVRGLIAMTIGGYALTILIIPVLGQIGLNPLFLAIGHLPEFCLGIFLAIRKEVKIPWWVLLISLAVLALGNYYKHAWPFANLAAALLLWVAVTRWLAALRPGSLTFRIITFIGMVSMYIFAIQGFTRWHFVNLANALSSPVCSMILGLMFVLFATGLAYLMMRSENGLRSWISAGLTRPRRYLRFFSIPILITIAIALLYSTSADLINRKTNFEKKPMVITSDSNTFEVIDKGQIQRYNDTNAYRGLRCYKMPPAQSFSPRLEIDFGKVDLKRLVEINASVMMFANDTLAFGQLVFEVYNKKTNERLVWKSASVDKGSFPVKKWFPCTYKYQVPKEFLFPNFFVRVYVWNCSKGLMYIDDLTLNAKGIGG